MDAPTITALASGQLVLRYFLCVYAKDGDGDPVTFGLWTGEDNVTTNVVSPQTGSAVPRSFVGGSSLIDDGSSIPQIVDQIGLEERGITLTLNHLHPTVESMVRGHTIRLAKAEFYRGLFSPVTGALVSDPLPLFYGRVSTSPINTPPVGGEGSVQLTLLPHHVDLTRTNPALKSDETQRLRDDDRLRRYADTAGQIVRWWGQARGAAETQQPTKKKGGIFGLGIFG